MSKFVFSTKLNVCEVNRGNGRKLRKTSSAGIKSIIELKIKLFFSYQLGQWQFA